MNASNPALPPQHPLPETGMRGHCGRPGCGCFPARDAGGIING